MLSIKKISLNDDIVWNDLPEDSQTATFFQSQQWLVLWCKYFAKKPDILGVYNQDKLVGIAPLLIKKQKARLLGLPPVLGSELVSDYGDIIAYRGKEKAVWQTVIRHLQVNKTQMELNFIREDSVSLRILESLGGRAEEVDVAPLLNLPSTWDEYLSQLSRHNRHELRRKIRRLETAGAFKICHEGGVAEGDEFFRLMKISGEDKRSFLSPAMSRFFREAMSVFSAKKMLSICFLKIKGENIAAVLSFVYRNDVLLYNSGFNPQFYKLAPGLILTAYLIKQSIEKGRKRFDFLRGGERYKYDLGGEDRKLYKIII